MGTDFTLLKEVFDRLDIILLNQSVYQNVMLGYIAMKMESMINIVHFVLGSDKIYITAIGLKHVCDVMVFFRRE